MLDLAAHIVFLVTAPVALVALAAVLALREVPLRGPGGPARLPERAPQERAQHAAAGAGAPR